MRERVSALPRDLPAAPAVLTPIRIDTDEPPFPTDPFRRGRAAAVLVLLFPDDEGQARVLLTTRVPQGIQHAGEVSFPGGHVEPTDADPIDTALREAEEEVALDRVGCGLTVIGALERVTIPVSGYRITPVVALAERRPKCRPAPDEVARILEAPVEAFLPDAPVELEERTIRQRLIRYGVYPVEGERVWGATARILGQLGALLATEVAVGEPAAVAQFGPGLEVAIRIASDPDRLAIDAFVEALAPELAHALPPASAMLLAEATGNGPGSGRIVGLASWAPWDRDRSAIDPRGFEGLTMPGEQPAELTLLAVMPRLRGHGIGGRLTEATADAAQASGSSRLLAWTLSDAAVHPSSAAARAFFRSNGFVDMAVDRRHLARGEDRLLLSRALR